MDSNISSERKVYLKKVVRYKRATLAFQIGILLAVIVLWEFLARKGVIDSFVMSSPSRIIKTVFGLTKNGLAHHIGVTLSETAIGFGVGALCGIMIAIALWWSKFLSGVLEPYLVVLNSLPKIALGPVIIIWVGAGPQAIIVMAVAISMIVTTLEMLNGFKNTDPEKVQMIRTFGANKGQIFTKIVLPSNLPTLFNSLKVNIGLSLVGVIAGEFLVSKAGLGYLIVYGGQVFRMDLVMASVITLSVAAALMYKLVSFFEKLTARATGNNKL